MRTAGTLDLGFFKKGKDTKGTRSYSTTFLGYLVPVLLLLVSQQPSRGGDVLYPPDAGVINVKLAYGAKGDGQTDDTNAILQAIRDHVGQYGFGILYFPAGTYMVGRRLDYLTNSGWWGSYLTIQGQNEANTTIRLIDNSPGFQDPTHPTAVIYTASNVGNDDPTSVWYNSDGSGNEGFRNHIMNITVNTGSNNPGAIGIDYMGNNNSTISGVTIASGDGLGVYGLNIQRGYPGPMLIKNLTITGFATAIPVSNAFGIWIEHLTLSGQSVSGLDVNNGSVSVRDLNSVNSVPAVRVPNWTGSLSLVDANLIGGAASVSAIQIGPSQHSSPSVFVRNASGSGYQSLISQGGSPVPGSVFSEWSSSVPGHLFPSASATPKSLNLTVLETPTYNDTDFTQWANVVSYGAKPNNPAQRVSNFDNAGAIQAAIDSGMTTVYLPPGFYTVSVPIHVRGNVKKVLGLSAYLTPLGSFPSGQPAIEIDNMNSNTVVIDNVGLSVNYWSPGPQGYRSVGFASTDFLNNSPQTVVVTNSDFIGYSNTPASANSTVFLESIYGNSMSFANQNIFARNLDPENWDASAHTNVSGGSLWALGLKVEGAYSSILAIDGAATVEVLGVAASIFVDVPNTTQAFTNQESSLSFSAFRTNPYPEGTGASDYDVEVQETIGGVSQSLFRSSSGSAPSAPSYGYGSVEALFVDAPLGVSVAPPPAATASFTDVLPTAYYSTAVELLFQKQITAGCSSQPLSYCPDQQVTRAQMAIFIVRAIIGGDTFHSSPTPYFGDVGPQQFGFAWIQKLKELGVTSGCGNGNFCPNVPVTRAQMAIFIIRARYGSTTSFSFSSNASFADVAPTFPEFAFIQRLKQDNITSGCSATLFCPGNPVTRGDMALFIMRGCFNQLLPSGAPIISQLSQNTIANGTTSIITITGVNTHFLQGTTTVNNVTGLTAGPPTVISPTSIEVAVTAQTGFAEPVAIWVTTNTEDAVLPNSLVIQ